MTSPTISWPDQSTCLTFNSGDITGLASDVYGLVCRTEFTKPGFCVIKCGTDIDSLSFRELMVKLKLAMATHHEQQTGNTLIYLSAGRFDQQTSTRPHLDGGPDESLLMLGYEPSAVHADVEISDYTRCGSDLGISPKEFMERHNPMFHAGFELLRPYASLLRCFDPSQFQIVVINNSSAPIDGQHWLGTLHTATITNQDDSKRRIINSTMLAPAPIGTSDVVSEADPRDFQQTTLVRRKGYDKTHLDDDR